MEPEELQGTRQPPRDVAGGRPVLQEKVSDHRTGNNLSDHRMAPRLFP